MASKTASPASSPTTSPAPAAIYDIAAAFNASPKSPPSASAPAPLIKGTTHGGAPTDNAATFNTACPKFDSNTSLAALTMGSSMFSSIQSSAPVAESATAVPPPIIRAVPRLAPATYAVPPANKGASNIATIASETQLMSLYQFLCTHGNHRSLTAPHLYRCQYL